MLEIGAAVKYLGPSAGCPDAARHAAPAGMVCVVVEIETNPDGSGHDILVQSAFEMDTAGWTRADELSPFDEWGLRTESAIAEGISL